MTLNREQHETRDMKWREGVDWASPGGRSFCALLAPRDADLLCCLWLLPSRCAPVPEGSASRVGFSPFGPRLTGRAFGHRSTGLLRAHDLGEFPLAGFRRPAGERISGGRHTYAVPFLRADGGQGRSSRPTRLRRITSGRMLSGGVDRRGSGSGDERWRNFGWQLPWRRAP